VADPTIYNAARHGILIAINKTTRIEKDKGLIIYNYV
jgi:hypothetical protein